MVDVKTQTTPVNPRAAIREKRQRRLRLVSGKPPTVKVWAANEAMREVLRHPTGVRFRDNLDHPVEWPHDSFTARRIADGSVRIDGAASAGEPPVADESLNSREHAAALKAHTTEESKPALQRHPDSDPQPQPDSDPQPQPAA